MTSLELVLSCEHGGNVVPTEHAELFQSRAARLALASHRGWDPGALALARQTAKMLGAPLHECTVTRLLVDTNRSPHHPRLFSEFSQGLALDEKERVLDCHYRPHRGAVERAIALRRGKSPAVLHVAVHSFVPTLEGKRRDVDVGLLYDPSRDLERRVCRRWKESLRFGLPGLKVRLNSPYRGTSDGLTTFLRRRFPWGYAGVELEVNQRLLGLASQRSELARRVLDALRHAIQRPE